MIKQKLISLLAVVLLFSTVGPSYSLAFDQTDNEGFESIDVIEIQQLLSNEEETAFTNNLEMAERQNDQYSEIFTSYNHEQIEVDSLLTTDLHTGEMKFTGRVQDGNTITSLDFNVALTYVENEDFGGTLIDNQTGQKYSFDTKMASASAIPVPLVIIAVQIVRYGVKWAVKKYGDDVVKAALKSSAHTAAKKIKKSLMDDDGVIISKFKNKVKGKQEYKDPKSGWSISRDVGKNNSHGGSYWKLMDKSGNRIATLDKNGKVLRE